MECKQCLAEMKDMGRSTGWNKENYYWCSECGTFLREEYITKIPAQNWYKPGYLFEQETS